MDSNRSENVRAKCPFYKSAKNNSIICEGITEEIMSIKLTFISQGKRREYSESFCEDNCYRGCAAAQCIYKKHEEIF